MDAKPNNSKFIRFLKDEKFIEWKLLSTDELEAYWQNFIVEHPEEKENLALAENHFEHIKLSSYQLSKDAKDKANKRLKESLRIYRNKRKIRRAFYVLTACAAILAILVFASKSLFQEQTPISIKPIVANQLESKDILLVAGNKTTAFDKNIDIQINAGATAQINSGENKNKEISIAKNTMNKLIVPYGKRSKIILADGTQVWLNSGSTLEFPSEFSEKRREIHLLSGEIYIEVAHDDKKTFHVHTSDYNVKVYGTKFNVNSSVPSSVVLVEGSVSLQSTVQHEVFLRPKQRATYSSEGTFSTQDVDIQPFISWKDGYLIFEDTPIIEVMKQIESYYNLSFIYNTEDYFQGLTCTGKIILSDNIDNVMTALTLISSTEYRKDDKLIFLYKTQPKTNMSMDK